MPGVDNNLYPPIISTYMPAFVRTTSCRVYFSLSNFNNIKDILNAQVVVSNQNNNMSALRSDIYPAGIKITNIETDESVTNDEKYYVIINASDLIGYNFELNQFYKVQIRFTGIEAAPLLDSQKIAPWLIANQRFFSEWSTVCLIRGIARPIITIKNLQEDKDTILTTSFVDIVGNMDFAEAQDIEQEYLEFYRIKVYNIDDEVLKYDSGDIYTNSYNPNEINYTIKTILEEGTKYEIVLTYTTVNGFSEELRYPFLIVQNSTANPLDATIKAESDNDNGIVKISLKSTINQLFIGHIIIKRTSSETNFSIWEEVHRKTFSGSILDYNWIDYTCESGVLYYYCAQKIDSQGSGGVIIKTSSPTMLELRDIFLLSNNFQVKVKFNPSISSFRNVIVESKVDTLGSKYPFITRNGNVNYKEFPITGLISSFWDEEGNFINKDTLYGENKGYYANHNEDEKISEYYDYIYERKFREKIMDFLYEDNVKLFRSNTEGNILIKLMDINFTPEETLGRMLFSFSATAYEVDECSIDNYQKYKIQEVGEFDTDLAFISDKLGQINGKFTGANQDVLKAIQSNYSAATAENYINTLRNLKWVRINFNSEPYFIKTTSGSSSIVPLPTNEKPTNKTLYGYIVYINGIPIAVDRNGIYELIDKDTQVTSIYFPVETDVTIDFIAEISTEEKPVKKYTKITYSTNIGQLSENFNVEQDVFNKIFLKHSMVNDNENRQFLSLDKVTIEAEQGVRVYVKDSFSMYPTLYVIGPTGVLELDDEEITIDALYFDGLQLYQPLGDTFRGTNFKESRLSVSSFEEINKPEERTCYLINNKRYIYYTGEWYDFTDENVVKCPVYVLIDYIYEMMTGEYI